MKTDCERFDTLLERYMLHFKDSPAMRLVMLGSYAESCAVLQHALDTNTPIHETLSTEYLTCA
jgi:hypothetical protein